MLHLLQADSLVASTASEAADAAKAALQGDTSAISHLGQQCLSLCVEAGKCIIVAILVYIVGRLIIRGINSLVARMLAKRGVDATIQSFVRSFVNVVLTILLAICVIGALGVNTTSFAALLASVGIAFGMALSGNLQNLAGGFIILLFRPFRVGDFIEAQGVCGTVKDIQIFHTIVLTADNKIVYLPNGALSSGSVVNTNNELRRVDLTYSVCYGQDIEVVKTTLNEVIAANPNVLTDDAHKPFIALSELGASVNVVVRLWVKGSDYWSVFFYMQETVYNTFNKKGIEFPIPHVAVHKA